MREEDRREEEEQVERRAREGIHDVECVVCGERPGFADGQILSFSRCARKRATARRIGTSPSSDPNSRAVGAARVDAKGASARSGVTGEGASRRNARANVAPGVVRRSRARGYGRARVAFAARDPSRRSDPRRIVRRPRRDARARIMWCCCGAPPNATGDGNTEADRFVVRTCRLGSRRSIPRAPRARARHRASLRNRVPIRRPGFSRRRLTARFALTEPPTPFPFTQRMDLTARSLAMNEGRLIVYGASPGPRAAPRSPRALATGAS